MPYSKQEAWRERMLKIRMQGTREDLEWFKKLLKRHENIKVMQVSEAFANKVQGSFLYVCGSRKSKKVAQEEII